MQHFFNSALLVKRNGLLLWLFVMPSLTLAQKPYSPYVNQDYPNNVYWGDTHLHTDLSTELYAMDYAFGNQRMTSDEAYRVARGETVKSINNMAVRLHRPLDFLMIADHAESFGVAAALDKGNQLLLKSKPAREWYQQLQEAKPDNKKVYELLMNLHFNIDEEIANSTFRQSVWNNAVDLAEHYNEPGKFTAMIGFEWSSRKPYYIHRVVAFKGDANKAKQVIPFSSWEGNNPEQLWDYMADYEQRVGGEMLAIPHNANMSQGKMFMETDFSGQSFDQDYAERRNRWEPLFEVTQTKGDSESHPMLSPNDEFADYEIWDQKWGKKTPKGTPEHLDNKRHEYARPVLKLGLKQQEKLGVNPFKFGLVGGTDGHLALPVIAENNFWGGHASERPFPERIKKWFYVASGYAGVWARENTRESLFDAMKRKETYASTGPRMTVRFFGGWDYQKNDALSPNLASIGYQKGVPMGGDLNSAPRNQSPTFLIRAVKDPDSANLDRVQVIKGWLDKNGDTQERIYNVALSDNRQADKQGNVGPVGNTVDIKNATYTNSIGDPELAVVWSDPDFNKNESAFYYLRVLEIPTPRWTAYDARFFNIPLEEIPQDTPMLTQERAYTSPIWYTP